MNIDLQRFCANENDPREYLRAPWRDGGWVYATNGHLVVRIRDDGAESIPARSSRHPNAAAMFRKHIEDRSCEFMVMPPITEPDKCTHCGGAGFVSAIKCEDCVDGEFTHGDYEYTCKNCCGSAAGPGWADAYEKYPSAQRVPCAHCDFMGYSLNRNGATNIGGALYSTVYLWALSLLPQCRICPGDAAYSCLGTGARETPAALIFDGGQALLMPRIE